MNLCVLLRYYHASIGFHKFVILTGDRISRWLQQVHAILKINDYETFQIQDNLPKAKHDRTRRCSHHHFTIIQIIHETVALEIFVYSHDRPISRILRHEIIAFS